MWATLKSKTKCFASAAGSLAIRLLSVLLWCAGLPSLSYADEPYERFLQKLRDEQLYDLALVYLDDLVGQKDVSAEFKADYDLERGILFYQSASVLSARSPDRVQKLDTAEVALRKFLAEKPSHPRRGESRLKLGELLLTRAEEAKSSFGGAAGEAIPEAIAFYTEAHELFKSTIQELANILSGLEGNRVDPADTAKVNYRQKIRTELRQAQLLSAKSIEERGRSRAVASAEFKADMEQSLTMFSDLYSKEDRMLGIRNYALFYRSGIQATLGRPDDAIDGFQRIADLVGLDVLRPLQTDATAELTKLLAEQGKYELALDRATRWLKDLRPDERKSAETIALQMELARARIAWAKLLSAEDPKNRTAGRLVSDARSDLRSLLRVVGPHLDDARGLMAELGVETVERATDVLPKVKDFSEAFAEAQKRLDQADTTSIEMEVLQARIDDPNLAAADKQEAQALFDETQEVVDTTRSQAIELLRTGLRLFDVSEDDRDQLFEARFRIAFLSLKLERPWDALVVGDFLARTHPGTEQGLRAAAVTLASFSGLLNQAADDKSSVISLLEPFAEYLVATWPQSSEAAAAAAALAQLAIIDKEWDHAEKYLGLVPSNPETASKRRDLGISLYVEYLQAKQDAGEDTAAVIALRDRATKWLGLATAELKAGDFTSSDVDAVNAQSRLLLSAGDDATAAGLLLDGERGLLKVLESKPDIASARTTMDAYRTAIQVTAAELVAGNIESNAAVAQMRAYVAKLQELAKSTEGGEEVLGGIFLALARDLKDKLAETKDVGLRTRLSDAVLLVVGEAAKSDSFNTQVWAANAKIDVAKELAAEKSGQTAAAKAYREGTDILQSILAKEAQQPGWIQPEGMKTQVLLVLARAQSGMGDHRAAVLGLGDILDEKNALLDVQIEVAQILQAWGADTPSIYESAIYGGRKKNGINVIWGWGKIAQMTTNQPNFTEQFFESRFQLARSRYMYAQTFNEAEQKIDQLQRAEKDILQTASLYPVLGGEAKKKQYDSLLRLIQKELGTPAKGLAVLNEKSS